MMVSYVYLSISAYMTSRDLGLLKRDKKLQLRYNAWAQGIREEHGSMGECADLHDPYASHGAWIIDLC